MINVHIEGPNGSGKSTLTDYVKNLLKYDQANLAHRDGDQFLRYLAEYGRTRTVFCRSHWSEAVYSELFGRRAPFSTSEFATLNACVKLRSVVVLCLPESAEVLRQRFLARVEGGLAGAMIEKFDQLGKEWSLWDRAFDPNLLDFTYLSRDHEDMVTTARAIVEEVRRRTTLLNEQGRG